MSPLDRPLALLLAVLAASAPIAAVAQDGLPDPLDAFAADGSGESGVSRSDDGRTVRVTDEALPASTGWVLVTVSPADRANVTFERTIHTNGSHGHGFGYAPYLEFDARFRSDDAPPNTFVQAHGDDQTAVSAEGETVGCCPRPDGVSHEATTFRSSANAGSFEAELRADDSVTLGFMASQWAPRDDFRARFTAAEAALQVEDVRRGTNVTVVDLVDAAERNGTGAHLGGQAVANDPGKARVDVDLPAGGLVHLDSDVEGNDQAEIEVGLPDGTVVDNGDGRNVSLRATALTGPGQVQVTLENLEEDTYVDQVSSRDDRRDHRVDADLVVADIAPSRQGVWQDLHRLQDPEVPDDVHSATVDDSSLPASDGWFVKEVTAPQATEVVAQVTVDVNGSDPGPRAYAPIIVSGDADRVFADHDEQPPASVASLNADGREARCCPVYGPLVDDPGRTHYRHLELGPNRSAYVGLAAVDWGDDDRFHVRLHPALDDGASDDDAPFLDVASGSQGTDVAYVDLVDAAARNGTNAEAFDRKVAGDDGSAAVGRNVENAGLVSLNYRFSGDETKGVLEVSTPDGTTYDNGDGRDVHGHLIGTVGPGALEVSLSDVERPGAADRAQGDDGWAYAELFYADVELPQRGVHFENDAVER